MNESISIICTLGLVMIVISADSISTEDNKSRLHMSSLGCDEGSPHLIRRGNIYEDVVKLYGDFQRIADEFHFRIAFHYE